MKLFNGGFYVYLVMFQNWSILVENYYQGMMDFDMFGIMVLFYVFCELVNCIEVDEDIEIYYVLCNYVLMYLCINVIMVVID